MSYNQGLQGFQLFIPPQLADTNSSWAATVVQNCDNEGPIFAL